VDETAKNRADQERFAEWLRRRGNVVHTLHPPKFHCDFFIISPKGESPYYAEYKRREGQNSRPDEDTYMISQNKVSHMRREAHPLDAYIIVEYDDEVIVGNIDKLCLNAEIRWSGRVDRGKRTDLEPCFFYPMKNFDRMPK
jgi:hypothetical protein